MIEHTKECLEEQEKRLQLIKDWKEKWPNYCRECSGRGVFDYCDYGDYWNPPVYDFDPCDTCLGTCPRCATKWEDPCDCPKDCWACGFNYLRPYDDGMPEPLEGPCWCEDSLWTSMFDPF